MLLETLSSLHLYIFPRASKSFIGRRLNTDALYVGPRLEVASKVAQSPDFEWESYKCKLLLVLSLPIFKPNHTLSPSLNFGLLLQTKTKPQDQTKPGGACQGQGRSIHSPHLSFSFHRNKWLRRKPHTKVRIFAQACVIYLHKLSTLYWIWTSNVTLGPRREDCSPIKIQTLLPRKHFKQRNVYSVCYLSRCLSSTCGK